MTTACLQPPVADGSIAAALPSRLPVVIVAVAVAVLIKLGALKILAVLAAAVLGFALARSPLGGPIWSWAAERVQAWLDWHLHLPAWLAHPRLLPSSIGPMSVAGSCDGRRRPS